MLRMMTYKEANLILKCSLSPNNRCICKKTALENHAQAALLAQFAQNRLVPVSRVQKQYYIVYKAADGSVLKTEWREPGETLNPPAHPVIEGMIPNGWAPDYTGIATGDAEYTALYEQDVPSSYTVRFLNYDGSVIETKEVIAGNTTTAPADPSRQGYTFNGWYTSDNVQFNNTLPINSNMDFTARYTKDKTPTLGAFYVTSVNENSYYVYGGDNGYYLDGRKAGDDCSAIYCDYRSGLPGGAPSSFTITVSGIHYKNGSTSNISGTFNVSNFGTGGKPTVTQSGSLDGLGVAGVAGRGFLFVGEQRVGSTNPSAPEAMDPDEYYKFNCTISDGHGLDWYSAMPSPINIDGSWLTIALAID